MVISHDAPAAPKATLAGPTAERARSSDSNRSICQNSGSRKPSGSAFVSTMVQPTPPRRSAELGAQVSASCAVDVSAAASASTTSASAHCALCVIGFLPSCSSTLADNGPDLAWVYFERFATLAAD